MNAINKELIYKCDYLTKVRQLNHIIDKHGNIHIAQLWNDEYIYISIYEPKKENEAIKIKAKKGKKNYSNDTDIHQIVD